MDQIGYYSTNRRAPPTNLRGALLQGQAPDRGLYLPERFPSLAVEARAEFAKLSYPEIAFRVLRLYVGDTIPEPALQALCEEAYNYVVPLEKVLDRVHILRLDQGPTASFKDFAARVMARLLGRFVRDDGQELTILTATSGDTGSAVANAFHCVEGIRVLVLFPLGEVSGRQRKQMTTLGDNIRTIGLAGKFDDCQALVKRAFADPALKAIPLSSANSINIGRLLPQSIYYFYAASRLAEPEQPMVFSVPSGNFGDMMGAMIAGRMGLPIRRLVVPVNGNDAFPRFLATGAYQKIEPSRNCLSNAMNVGHPSNLARLVDLFGGWMDETGRIFRPPDRAAMQQHLYSVSVSDELTRATIREAWSEHKLLLEPHGAVAWRGFLEYRQTQGSNGFPVAVLETAHPAKFPEEIRNLLNFDPRAPASLASLDRLSEDYDQLDTDYPAFRNYLLTRYSRR